MFETWAKHSRDSQLRRVISKIPQASVKKVPATLRPEPANENAAPSYAQVVRGPATVKVICTGGDDGKNLCIVPNSPKRQIQKDTNRRTSTRGKQEDQKKKQKLNKKSSTKGEVGTKVEKLRGLMSALWMLVKPFIETIKESSPSLAQLYALLESSDLVSKIIETLSVEH